MLIPSAMHSDHNFLLVDHHKSGKSGKKRKKTKGSNLPEENNSSIVSLPLRDMMSTKSFSSGNIITPTSTLTRNKPNHSQVHLMPERSILDRNASTYSSFLHMRGVNTRWERRWFTLQKSILTYTRWVCPWPQPITCLCLCTQLL